MKRFKALLSALIHWLRSPPKGWELIEQPVTRNPFVLGAQRIKEKEDARSVYP